MNKTEYLSASSFKVSIENTTEAYESVTGLGGDIEDIPFQGEDKGISNKPGRFNARDIILTRRFTGNKNLYQWFKDLKQGKKTMKSGSIILLNEEEKEVVRFNFFNAWPKGWLAPSVSKDAAGNDVLVETVVLSVKDIEMA